MPNINQFSPSSGRYIKDDGSVVNLAEMIEAIYNALVVDKNAGIDVIDRAVRVLGKITADDAAITALGALAAAAVTDPTASASVIALLKGLLKQLQGTGTGAVPTTLTGSNVADGGSLPSFVLPVAASDGSKVRFIYAATDRRLEVWSKRLDYLNSEHDTIDVARMSKGPISIPPVFDAVTTGGTSQEIFCGGFNALLLHHVISGGTTGGYATIKMSPKSLGTFIDHHGKGQNIKNAATTTSYISLFEAIFDYIKVVLTVTDGTHTVIVQPINL